jgi:hypothetical protein
MRSQEQAPPRQEAWDTAAAGYIFAERMNEWTDEWFPVFPQGWSIFVCLVKDFQSIPEGRASFGCGAGHLPLKICPRDACLGWGSVECRLNGMPLGQVRTWGRCCHLVDSIWNKRDVTPISSKETLADSLRDIVFCNALDHVSRALLNLLLFCCWGNKNKQ